jgi:hypothetical protein
MLQAQMTLKLSTERSIKNFEADLTSNGFKNFHAAYDGRGNFIVISIEFEKIVAKNFDLIAEFARQHDARVLHTVEAGSIYVDIDFKQK